MPKRKRSRKNVGRRKRSFKRRRQRLTLVRNPRGIFAKTFKQSFRYVDTVTLDPGVGDAIAYHSFSANGMYDPDITGVGHQPMGFDQLVGITHVNYVVIGSRIKCTFMSQSDNAGIGTAYVGVLRSKFSTPISTSINDVMESKQTRVYTMTSADANQKKIVSSKMNVGKFLGTKVMQEDDTAGSVGANPAEQAYYVVFAASNNLGTDPASIQVLIELEYIAVLKNPRQLAGS